MTEGDWLLQLVQDFALSSIDASREEQTPDADETLLRILADELRIGERPRPSDILTKAQQVEPEGFKRWSGRGVSAHLKRYGLETRKIAGDKVYMPDLLGKLQKVQQSYGIDLGFGSE